MLKTNISLFSHGLQIRRGLVFGLLIITALFAFELFNYSTTDFALTDLLGDLDFLGISWATILAIAFCGIDFAGIARLFTPEQGADEPAEVWYLFGAWMLAALMNAMLTWWGVSIAIINHQTLGNAVVARGTLIKVVPIFVAVMVWLIRVLIIGTMSIAGDRLFSQANISRSRSNRTSRGTQPAKPRSILPVSKNNSAPVRRGIRAASYQSTPRPDQRSQAEPTYEPLETTYNPVSFSKERSTHTRQARF